MSDTSAALRAAKEVQADVLAPELYRLSSEWFSKSKREYRFKNFHLAQQYANKARSFAEQAEFTAIRNGGNRSVEQAISDPLANDPTALVPSSVKPNSANPSENSPDISSAPQGTSMEILEQKEKEKSNEISSPPVSPPENPSNSLPPSP